MDVLSIAELRARVDVVIISVREQDELPALRARFPIQQRASGRLEYSIARVRRDDGCEGVVALVCTSEGFGAAQETTNAIIDDLSPPLLLMVGIAGGIPQADGSLALGDVVISSAGLDVTSGELLPNERVRTRPKLFELSPTSKKLVDALRIDMPRVAVDTVGVERPAARGAVIDECPSDWKVRAETAMRSYSNVETPYIHARLATVASGGLFTKDPVSASKWEKEVKKHLTADPLLAIEMELVGISRASNKEDRRQSWLSIRGISDIVGLERQKQWSQYAAAAAAAVTEAFVKWNNRPVRATALRGVIPDGTFEEIDFRGQPNISAALDLRPPTPVNARFLATSELAERVVTRLASSGFALLVGVSGSGKSTLGLGVAGRLADTRRVFAYRPALNREQRVALSEIVAFAEHSQQRTLLLLDDVNAWASVSDLERISQLASDRCNVIATLTSTGAEAAPAELRFASDRVVVTWSDLRESVEKALLDEEPAVVEWLRANRPSEQVGGVGYDALQTPLHALCARYAEAAQTVWQFMFLLRGGWSQVHDELQRLVEDGRSDVPLVHAAIEQIAGFELPVYPRDVVTAISSVPVIGLPAADETWVTRVFDALVSRRLMKIARGAYTTIHRDWARALISESLADQKSANATKLLLDREFDLRTRTPRRLMILWSWFYYDEGGAGLYVHEWKNRSRHGDWSALILSATRSGLEDLALVAGRLHVLFPDPGWKETLARAFAEHEELIGELVSCASSRDWHSLRELFMALNQADAALASRVIREWDPSVAAAALEASVPADYDAVHWLFAGVGAHSRRWLHSVGARVRWERISEQLAKALPGRADDVIHIVQLLALLGLPLMRSRLRRVVDVVATVLEEASLSQIDLDDVITIIQVEFFPAEMLRLVSRLNAERLAREVSMSSPTLWGRLLMLTIYADRAGSGFGRSLVDKLDVEQLVDNVTRKYRNAPARQLRMLLWQISLGEDACKRVLGARLQQHVTDVARADESEREPLLQALAAVDPSLSKKASDELGLDVTPSAPLRDELLQPMFAVVSGGREIAQRLAELDATGEDYDVDQILDFRDRTTEGG